MAEVMNGAGNGNPPTGTISALIEGGIADRHGQLVAERDSLVGQLAMLQHLREAQQAEMDEMHRELVEVRTERTEAQAQLSDLRVLYGGQQHNIAMYQEQEATFGTRYARLEERLTQATALTATVVAERDQLETIVARKDREMEDFKGEVVRVASEAADEHNWCSVIDDILSELGLERIKPSYLAELTITVRFSATRTDSRDLPTRNWVHDSIRRADLEQVIRQNFEMDHDNTDVEINGVSFNIEDIEENS